MCCQSTALCCDRPNTQQKCSAAPGRCTSTCPYNLLTGDAGPAHSWHTSKERWMTALYHANDPNTLLSSCLSSSSSDHVFMMDFYNKNVIVLHPNWTSNAWGKAATQWPQMVAKRFITIIHFPPLHSHFFWLIYQGQECFLQCTVIMKHIMVVLWLCLQKKTARR